MPVEVFKWRRRKNGAEITIKTEKGKGKKSTAGQDLTA